MDFYLKVDELTADEMSIDKMSWRQLVRGAFLIEGRYKKVPVRSSDRGCRRTCRFAGSSVEGQQHSSKN